MMIYADNAATTKLDIDAFEAMTPYLLSEYGNASQPYSFSRAAKKAIKEARQIIASCINATPEEIYFTSGGTESDNWAIQGVIKATGKKHIITTKVEHPCVLNVYKALETQGYKVDYIGVNSYGELDLAELEEKISKDTALVSCMWANNETGIIFPIEKISETIKRKNPDTKFFVDAVQAAGKIPAA